MEKASMCVFELQSTGLQKDTSPYSRLRTPGYSAKLMLRLACNSRSNVRPLRVCRRLFSQRIQQPHQKLWNALLAGEVDVIDDQLVTVLKLRNGVQWSLAEASSELFVRKCNLDLF